ncbi:hypothetical protein D5085_02540 [Ectothiorhodospiraceae bacterium BW-2]|nr:hypothetical protein D5085_02540 [Ectothiorhodospiraceae bacterium BW-2]
MATLHQAVQTANDNGALALMIYVIPNFPDPDTYHVILDILHEHPSVTIIETTFPVTSKFSDFANQIIRTAHQTASQYQNALTVLETLQAFKKPSVAVVYQEVVDALGFEILLQKMYGKIDSVLLEWEVEDVKPYVEQSKRYDIEFIQCVYPEMTEADMEKYLGSAVKEPLVYLTSASMTGAKLFSHSELNECIRRSKAYRSDIKIMAGFGVRTPDDIRKLKQLEKLDGVIIGTAFLEVMRQGVDQVTIFLDSLTPALLLD